MSKVNPKIFEPYIDPEKGEWIRFVSGTYKDVVWRPVDIMIGEETVDGSGVDVNYKVEILEGPEFPTVDINDSQFEKICGKVIYDLFEAMAANENNV